MGYLALTPIAYAIPPLPIWGRGGGDLQSASTIPFELATLVATFDPFVFSEVTKLVANIRLLVFCRTFPMKLSWFG